MVLCVKHQLENLLDRLLQLLYAAWETGHLSCIPDLVTELLYALQRVTSLLFSLPLFISCLIRYPLQGRDCFSLCICAIWPQSQTGL